MLAGEVRKAGTALIFINQIREKIGVQYGNPETTPWGRALAFYASLRQRMNPAADTKESASKVTTIKAVKNKCNVPFRSTEVNIVYGEGFDGVGQTIDLAMEMGIVERGGAYYSFMGTRIGMGKEKVIEILRSDSELLGKISEQLNERLAA